MPELLTALRKKNQLVHNRAANALVVMTWDGVPGLLQKVRAAERKGQWVAEAQIAAAGANPLLPLLKDLSDKDPQTRVRAALTLGQLGVQAKPALPALIRALGDDDRQVRLSVAIAVAHIQRNETETKLIADRARQEVRERMAMLPRLNRAVRDARIRELVWTYIIDTVTNRNLSETAALDWILPTLGPEAIPALVDGVNFVAGAGLGDC